MANKQNQSGGSQGAPGTSQQRKDVAAGPGPDEGQRSGQQQVELPEHQGVITDYVPPKGGMRSEVGDLDAESEDQDTASPEAGDQPLPGHMGGGLAGG